MSTHNICFHREIRKILSGYPLLSGDGKGYAFSYISHHIGLGKSDGLGGSVGCVVRLETRRSRVQPPPRSATFFRGD